MPFVKGHPEYRTKKSINKLKKTQKILFANRHTIRKCPTCSTSFDVYKKSKKKWCSLLCRNKNIDLRKQSSIKQKGKKMSESSRRKMSETMNKRWKFGGVNGFKKGEGHWAWRGGVTEEPCVVSVI